MSAPAGGIITGEPLRCCPIGKHSLNTAANSRRRLRLRGPNWTQDREDQLRINVLNRKVTNDWVGVGLQCRAPVVSVLITAPTWRVGTYVIICTLSEGNQASRRQSALPNCAALCLKWIDAIKQTLTRPKCPLACLCQAYGV